MSVQLGYDMAVHNDNRRFVTDWDLDFGAHYDLPCLYAVRNKTFLRFGVSRMSQSIAGVRVNPNLTLKRAIAG
jgi:hypothetical protein